MIGARLLWKCCFRCSRVCGGQRSAKCRDGRSCCWRRLVFWFPLRRTTKSVQLALVAGCCPYGRACAVTDIALIWLQMRAGAIREAVRARRWICALRSMLKRLPALLVIMASTEIVSSSALSTGALLEMAASSPSPAIISCPWREGGRPIRGAGLWWWWWRRRKGEAAHSPGVKIQRTILHPLAEYIALE